MAEHARVIVVAASHAIGPVDEGLVVVPRPRAGRWRAGWRPLAADAVLDALDRGGADAIVLAPAPSDDPGAVPLVALARRRRRAVVLLPAERPRALWTITLARRWARSADAGVLRRIQACAALTPVCDAGAWDARLGWRALGRLMGARWHACAWCAGGGGAAGRCAGCGGIGVAG